MKLHPLLQSVYIISLFCEFVFCSVRGKLYFEQFYGFFEVLFSSINVVNPQDITEILLCHSPRYAFICPIILCRDNYSILHFDRTSSYLI